MVAAEKRLPSSDAARESFEAALRLEDHYDFISAKRAYEDIVANLHGGKIHSQSLSRLEDMTDLIEEKALYERVDENAKRFLCEVGMNVSESAELMNILIDANAIDFENTTSVFIPLRREYVDECVERVPRQMSDDPGPNSFGTGATAPFLKRKHSDELLSANRDEFAEICSVVNENSDAINIFSLPVATDRSITGFEVSQMMDRSFNGLKMTVTMDMSEEEATFLKGRSDWVDGTSLITSFGPMDSMVDSFLRSARIGNNLLLLDQCIAGLSGAGTPEALLTQVHAQVLFMMVIAQTVTPGIFCMHGGMPSVAELNGTLSYSSPHQPLINAAMARLNLWVTCMPSAQSGGSTSLQEVSQESIMQSTLSRNTLRKYGVHVLRHAMGNTGSLNFFSLEKFIEDCEQERQAEQIFDDLPKDKGVIPLYVPDDEEALEGLREIAVKGCNPKYADHTLKNVSSFSHWEGTINEAAKRKLYYPQLNDTVIEKIQQVS